MATIVNNSKHRGSKNHKYGSKMAARNVEIRAVGAWIQPEPLTNYLDDDAVASARVEEARIKQLQEEKESRLQHFQEEVRKRVLHLQRLKHQQQLQNSYNAAEAASKVVHQSAFAAELGTPRKNRCSVRPEKSLAISSHGRLSQAKKSSASEDEVEPSFEEHTNQVHTHVQQARRKLTSRQVINELYEHDDLPGGVWRSGPTRDHPASRRSQEALVLPLSDEGTKPLDQHAYQSELDSDSQPTTSGSGVKVVTFKPDPPAEDARKDRISRKSTACLLGSQVERVPQVPVIHPGVVCEEERQRAQSQRAMYRRLFMDIEREQVKENIRRKQHRKQIQQLKKSAEAKREHLEELAQQMIEPEDRVGGETVEEVMERERREEQDRLQQSIEEDQRRKQKGKETERFLEALKQNLREKIEKQDIELPPMCCCASSIWDTNPDTCANNCVFYKNPKGYARALQSLLASCDVI